MTQKISNKIYIYSFVLSILVIFVHAENLAENNLELMNQAKEFKLWSPLGIENFFSNTIGQGAVPGFFLLSGYLFFRKLESIRDIPEKWGKRIRSLVIPYCFWNSFWYFLYAAAGRAEWSFSEWSEAVANFRFNPVFWYLYQLILLTALAAVFYLLLKNPLLAGLSWIGFLVLVYRLIDLPYVNEDALFYYFTGAVLGSFGKKLVETEAHWKSRMLMAGLCTFLLGLLLEMPNGAELTVLLTVLYRLSLALFLWTILPADWLPAAPGYMKQNFFLYAIHYGIVRSVFHILKWAGILGRNPLQIALLLLSYFLLPVLIVWLSTRLAGLLRRKFPTLWRIVSGGR